MKGIVFRYVDQSLESKNITVILTNNNNDRHHCEVVNYYYHWCQKFK